MKIRIYGTGCARCRQLFDNVRAALDASGIDAEIEKVTDIGAIASSGVMATPALEVDGRIVATGAVPSAAAIAKLLPTEEAACSCCSCGGRSASEKACTAEEGGDGKGGCSCSRGERESQKRYSVKRLIARCPMKNRNKRLYYNGYIHFSESDAARPIGWR